MFRLLSGTGYLPQTAEGDDLPSEYYPVSRACLPFAQPISTFK